MFKKISLFNKDFDIHIVNIGASGHLLMFVPLSRITFENPVSISISKKMRFQRY